MSSKKNFATLICLASVGLPAFSSSVFAQVNLPSGVNQRRIDASLLKVDLRQIKNFSSIKLKAQTKPIRLIVRLSDSAVKGSPNPAKISPAPFVGLQSSKLSKAQSDFLSRASTIGLQGSEKISSTPLLVVSANASQLDKLVQSGEVAEVYEDFADTVNLDVSGPLIDAPALWSAGGRGQGQTVAIIDTGVDSNHPAFRGKIVDQSCFTSNDGSTRGTCPGSNNTRSIGGNSARPLSNSGPWDHGTHVAAIAAGKASGTYALNGVAPDAKIMAINVCSRKSDGRESCYTSDQIRALTRVRDRAQALNIASVNISIGGGRYTSNCTNNPARPIISQLRQQGVAVVIAAGNNGYRDAIGRHACVPEAIAVGATDDRDQVASFSNISRQVDLLAPGVSINAAKSGGSSVNKSGTSMAAPQVAGAFAAYRSKDTTRTVDQMLRTLKNTGVPIRVPGTTLTIPRLDLTRIAGVGTSTRAQRIVMNKKYRIKDDEVFKDQFLNANRSLEARIRKGQSASLKSYANRNSPRHCAGGEVRIEDWDRVKVENDGTAKLWVSVQLYEGSSCRSNDLDGQKIGVRSNNQTVGQPFLVIPPNATRTKKIKVRNTSEGGDYVTIEYTVRNNSN